MIVYDAPYNQDIAGPRAHDWAEVEALVMDRVARARECRSSPAPGLDDRGAERLSRRIRPA